MTSIGNLSEQERKLLRKQRFSSGDSGLRTVEKNTLEYQAVSEAERQKRLMRA